MANELVRHGISVRIVDKSAERTDKSKALVLWSRTLELFDHAGYVEPFLAAGMQAHGAQISNGKDVIARISLDDIDSPYPYALMIPQSETERVLEERLAKRGVKVERTVALESFTEQGNGVEAVLRKAERRERDAHGRLADRLRRRPFDRAARARLHLRRHDAAQRLVSGRWPHHRPRSAATTCTSSGTRDGILAFFPITEGRWRVIADLGPAEDERPPRRSDPGGDPGADRRMRGTDGIVSQGRRSGWRPSASTSARSRTTAAAASSWPATPPTSTARPAARA